MINFLYKIIHEPWLRGWYSFEFLDMYYKKQQRWKLKEFVLSPNLFETLKKMITYEIWLPILWIVCQVITTWFHEFQIPNFLEIFYLLERDFVGLFVTPNLSKSDLLWLE